MSDFEPSREAVAAPLQERMHGRECAHRAKGNDFDASLLSEARGSLAELKDILRLLVTRIQLDIRCGTLPPEWGGDILTKAADAMLKAREQGL